MKGPIKKLSYLIMLITVITACHDDQLADGRKVSRCNGKLKDQEISQIKSCLTGVWQMHYYKGGITGPAYKWLTPETYFSFTATDSVYGTWFGEEIIQDKIQWRTVEADIPTSEPATVMSFEDLGNIPYNWVPEGIETDTLVFFENSVDGSLYYLTKVD